MPKEIIPRLEVTNADGIHCRADAVAAGVFRVRCHATGLFTESLQERYGLIRTLPGPATQRTTSGIATDSGSLRWHTERDAFSLLAADGTILIETIELWTGAGERAPVWNRRVEAVGEFFRANRNESGSTAFNGHWQDAQGAIIGAPESGETTTTSTATPATVSTPCGAALSLLPGERAYGLGAASARKIQLRGGAYRNWTQYFAEGNLDRDFAQFEQTEGPVPFLMVLPEAGAKGPARPAWGVFFNTSGLNFFDVGRLETDRLLLLAPQGELDLYFFVAADAPALLERFTALTGRPSLLPRWGYGFHYVSNIMADQHVVIDEAERLRREGIPCDVFGLEPNWMAKFYDNSRNRQWDCEKRFYMPTWMPRQHSLVGALDRLGFKLSLWVNCDQDFSIEAERRRAVADGEPDPYPDAPADWMEHLRPFMDLGAAAFKIDPNSTTAMHPGRIGAGGRGDLELHNLQQTLVRMAMQRMVEAHTGQRAMFHYCGGWSGSQAYGAITMGDNGGEALALAWMIGHGLSGGSNTACDMAPTPWRTWPARPAAGLHFGFLSPWAQLNNWSSSLQPWLLGSEGSRIFREYARLRYQLLPYIYSAAHTAAQTGLPILRAMPLAYPDDPACNDLITQYMLGDSLLVSAFTERVWLPEGLWYDWWTGAETRGGCWIEGGIPADRGGHLFVRAGAVIPMWDDPPLFIPRRALPHDYTGVHRAILNAFAPDAPEPVLTFRVWPGAGSKSRLFEDDGEWLDYRTQPVAGVALTVEAMAGGRHRLVIAPPENMEGAAARPVIIRFSGRAPAEEILVQGRPLKSNPGLRQEVLDHGWAITGLLWDREFCVEW